METNLVTLLRRTRNLYMDALDLQHDMEDSLPNTDTCKLFEDATTKLICAAAELQNMVNELGSSIYNR